MKNVTFSTKNYRRNLSFIVDEELKQDKQAWRVN